MAGVIAITVAAVLSSAIIAPAVIASDWINAPRPKFPADALKKALKDP